jgi:integrase/recombinase XerD
VLPPDGRAEYWTVIGTDLRPVEPVERYLAWLSPIERAPTSTRAYAHDPKTFWEFVEARGLVWDAVSLQQLGEFTCWLRAPADNVVVLDTGRAARSASTVSRTLTAVFGF